jgi:hypothetical protein
MDTNDLMCFRVRILVGKPEGKREHWEDEDVDG